MRTDVGQTFAEMLDGDAVTQIVEHLNECADNMRRMCRDHEAGSVNYEACWADYRAFKNAADALAIIGGYVRPIEKKEG